MGYKHFTIFERESIFESLSKGEGVIEIAIKLGRAESSIRREIKRNSVNGSYSPSIATEKYKERKSRCGRKKVLSNNTGLVKTIEDMLKADLSPEQVSGRLKLENKETVCFKTIYRGIYTGVVKVEVEEVLRRKGKSKAHGVQEKRGIIPGKTMIDQRPAIIEKRLEIGHFENDTMIGAGKKGAIATFVERKSRYLFAEIMPDRTSSRMTQTTIALFENIPKQVLKTFTSDNGKEFAGFKEVEEQLGIKNYFAHPYHSWERGTNENTNGLIRQYFPKGTDFTRLSSGEVQKVVERLNNRPRKVLGFKTPNEVFWDELKKCN